MASLTLSLASRLIGLVRRRPLRQHFCSFVDEGWHALRANLQLAALIPPRDQRDVRLGAATIQTGGRRGSRRGHPFTSTVPPPRYFCMKSPSCPGVKPVSTDSHLPTPFSPPASAFVIFTSVSFGTVFSAWLSASPPKMNCIPVFCLWKRLSVWCMGMDQSRVR